jgi:uncharacterized protein YhfF
VSVSDAVARFWAAFRALDPAAPPAPDLVASFGDTLALCDDLTALVAAGTKTATAGLLWEYEAEGAPLPWPGCLSVFTTAAGEPRLVVETTEVRVVPFADVDADFAYDEGEDDRTLASWRAGHWRYFGRRCAAIGREPSESMPVVCERFRLRFPPPGRLHSDTA